MIRDQSCADSPRGKTLNMCPTVIKRKFSSNRATFQTFDTTNQDFIMTTALAGNNMEEEFLWSCTLTGSNKEYSWDPASLETAEEEKEDGPKVKPSHRLLIKTAVLMPTAKKDEVTVVQIESEGYNKQQVNSVLSLLVSVH